MPFRSEKQRRFLWAAHPDIAKRWAHDYPKPKKLPMYVDDKEKEQESEEKAAMKSTNNLHFDIKSLAAKIYSQNSKQAESTTVKMNIPHSEEPTAAGENPVTAKETGRNSKVCAPVYKKQENSLFNKLSAVLSQSIMQAIENEKAEAEARAAQLQPMNSGIKRYAMPAAATPPPMGMAQAPAQPAPAQAPSGQLPPVGGGNSPNANPINSYGALSSTGDINGNASFGTANSAGGEKVAVNFNAIGRAIGKAVGGVVKKPLAAAAKPPFKMPANPTHADLMAYGKQIGYGEKMPHYTHQEFANYQLMKSRLHQQNARASATGARPAANPTPVARPAPVARPVTPPVTRPAPTLPAKPTGGMGDELSLDDDIINSMESFGKNSSSSPAWQRASGKNPEGGLNEKGRKSYERETGGNLKAPVTESNPSGERAKRQNSFCSRMCGMKRVNTGAKTKSDPDSRINKSLRKWNCKCSSAYEFGAKLASALIAK